MSRNKFINMLRVIRFDNNDGSDTRNPVKDAC